MEDLNTYFHKYEDQSMNTIIQDNIISEDELHKQWNAFMSMYKKKRRDSDDMSIALTGLTNEERYQKQLADFSLETCIADINKSITSIQQSQSVYTEALQHISLRAIDLAKEWNRETNMFMIYPSEDLEQLYADYQEQPKDQQMHANWKCMDLFGMDNDQLYMVLKSEKKKKKLITIEDKDDYELSKDLITIQQVNPSTITETKVLETEQDKLIMEMNQRMNQTIQWEFMYAPCFTPMEIQQLRGFYAESVADKYNVFQESYTKYYHGQSSVFNIVSWKSELDRLYLQLEYTKSIEERNTIKESILAMGWNPEIKNTPENQKLARLKLEQCINESYKNITIRDIHSLYEEDIETISESPEIVEKMLYPIHIVLVKGTTVFSDIVTKFTNGPYSHSAIALDGDFNRLYSFNMDAGGNDKGTGLSLESIKGYPKENRLGVFTFFVNAETYKKINKNLQYFMDNIARTTYSVANVVTLPFKQINLNRDLKQICSQFVDHILKLSDIDLTNIKSDKVTPNYLYNISIKNSKIYQIYDGAVKNFNEKKASRTIKRMQKKATPITEMTFLEALHESTYIAVLTEAKKFPIQFNDNGDLLITTPDAILDLNQEYFNSHKLLLKYEKEPKQNLDGIKYELARLYFINYLLEKRIYGNARYRKYKDEYIKTRARVLNDFNKYIAIVLKIQPGFNFAKYYEDSPFYYNTVEVKSSTIRQVKQILKDIL